jgi:hypothetical protein
VSFKSVDSLSIKQEQALFATGFFHTDVFLFRWDRDREELFFYVTPKSANDSESRSGFGPAHMHRAGRIAACFVFWFDF